MDDIVAVTGATGYVGRFVVAELLRQGMKVRALARPESDRGGFDGSTEWIDGSLRSDEALSRLVKDAGAVAHLAYEHVPGRYRGGEGDNLAGWLDANVNGSLRLLTAAREARVEKFIFLSSRAVFSRTEPGHDLDESHPISPDTHYGAYKAAVESFLHSFAQVEKMQTCSVRATGVYGVTWPVERSKWWGLVNSVVCGEPITSNGGGTEVYGGDVARVISTLLKQPVMSVDTVHLSDLYVSHREVVRRAREISGIPGDLPPEPSKPPENVMVSRNLSQLGITLSGLPVVETTVAELVRLAQAKMSI
ncbi:MAG: NAD(P)-dependent oxidoreductase [Chloroflexota bacterium]